VKRSKCLVKRSRYNTEERLCSMKLVGWLYKKSFEICTALHSSARRDSVLFNLEEPCVLYIRWAYCYPPDVAFYILFSANISTEYFKHAAHSPFFSSKCRLFHNATFLVRVLFTFYIQGVLKLKCKTPVPKG